VSSSTEVLDTAQQEPQPDWSGMLFMNTAHWGHRWRASKLAGSVVWRRARNNVPLALAASMALAAGKGKK
jgi:hypothetical protein